MCINASDRKNAQYYLGLAQSYEAKGDLNFADAMYQKAVELDSSIKPKSFTNKPIHSTAVLNAVKNVSEKYYSQKIILQLGNIIIQTEKMLNIIWD